MECAPLVLHGYESKTTNFSQTGLADTYGPTGFPEVMYVQYLYGPSSGVTEDANNATYTFNNDSIGYDTNPAAEQPQWNVLYVDDSRTRPLIW